MEEEWKEVAGFAEFYQVSSLGRVRSLDRQIRKRNGVTEFKKGKLLKIVYAGNMYGRVILYGNGKGRAKLIHRLVAEVFIENPNNLREVNHKDLDKTNNLVSNLEWVTPQRNTIHAFENREIKRYKGIENHSAILSEDDVRLIRKLYKTGNYTQKEIGKIIGVHYSVIGYVVRGQTWRHISE